MAGYDTSWGSSIAWSPSSKKGGWGGAASGAAQGAALGSSIMPGWGTAIGAIGGALFGGLGSKKLSEAEQLVNNWDALKNKALKEYGVKGISGMWGGIEDFSTALKDWGGKVPGLEQLYGALGSGEAAANKLTNYKPERIDKNIAEEAAYRKNVNTNINPLALRQRRQADQAALMRKGGPATGAQQQLMAGQDRRAAEQAIAEQGVGMIEGSRGRTAQLSQAGDQLVQRALEAGGNLWMNLAQGYAAASRLGLEGQTAFLEGLYKIPGLYEQFMSFLKPGDAQYGAAAQGGRTGNTLSSLASLAQSGREAYDAFKYGGKQAWGGYHAPGQKWRPGDEGPRPDGLGS